MIIIDGLKNSHQEKQELCVFIRGIAGGKEIFTRVGGQRPVVMFAGTIDAGIWFFVKQAYKAVFFSYPLHGFHRQLIVVAGGVGVGKDGGHFVLGGSNFIVLCL